MLWHLWLLVWELTKSQVKIFLCPLCPRCGGTHSLDRWLYQGKRDRLARPIVVAASQLLLQPDRAQALATGSP